MSYNDDCLDLTQDDEDNDNLFDNLMGLPQVTTSSAASSGTYSSTSNEFVLSANSGSSNTNRKRVVRRKSVAWVLWSFWCRRRRRPRLPRHLRRRLPHHAPPRAPPPHPPPHPPPPPLPPRRTAGSLEEVQSKKSSAAAERQAKKERQAEERAARLALVEANKIYKPGECIKYMCIEMHPSLSGAWYMADVCREAALAGCRAEPAPDLCDRALVMWTRAVSPTLEVTGGQVGLSAARERCSRALYVLEASEVAELVQERALAERLANVRDLTTCDVTLLVFGAKDYFKKSQRKTTNSNKQLMTSIDLEMAITDALVSAGSDAWLAETPNELALHIVQVTKAIAEAPHKQAKRDIDEQADFYMRGDAKNCIAVDKDGNGVSRLWQQMLSSLSHASLEVSRSLTAAYRSPRALHEALKQPEGIHTVAALGVSRAAAPGARARRLGPEFATKLHTLFTSEDGDALVD